MPVKDLVYRISADLTPLERQLRAADRMIDRLDKDAQSKYGALSSGLRSAGQAMTAAVTAPLVLAAGASVKAFAGFDEQMRNVNSIAKMNEAQFQQMSQQVVNMSTKYGKSAQDLAAGLFDINSSGFAGADGVKVLDAATQAARAGVADVATSASGLTAVLNAYGMSADQAGKVSDIMFKTVERGVITFPEMASQIGSVVSTSSAAGVKFEEVGAALSVMTRRGINAAESTTALNQLLVQLVSPSEQAQKAAASMGLSWLANGQAAQRLKEVGLEGVMKEIAQATGGNIEAMTALFPEVRAMKAALALGADGAREFSGDLKQMQNASGSAAAALKEQQKSLQSALDRAKASAMAFVMQIGQDLAPMVRVGARGLELLAAAARQVPAPMRYIAIGLAGVVAAAGPALWIAGSLAGAYRNLMAVKLTLVAVQRARRAATVASTAANAANTGSVSAKIIAQIREIATQRGLATATGQAAAATATQTAANTACAGSTNILTLALTRAATAFKALWAAAAAPVAIGVGIMAAVTAVETVYENRMRARNFASRQKGSDGYEREQDAYKSHLVKADSARLAKELANNEEKRSAARKQMKNYEEGSWWFKFQGANKDAYAQSKYEYNVANERVIWLKKQQQKGVEAVQAQQQLSMQAQQESEERRKLVAENEEANRLALQDKYVMSQATDWEKQKAQAWVDLTNTKRDLLEKQKQGLDVQAQMNAAQFKYNAAVKEAEKMKAEDAKRKAEESKAEQMRVADANITDSLAGFDILAYKAETAGNTMQSTIIQAYKDMVGEAARLLKLQQETNAPISTQWQANIDRYQLAVANARKQADEEKQRKLEEEQTKEKERAQAALDGIMQQREAEAELYNKREEERRKEASWSNISDFWKNLVTTSVNRPTQRMRALSFQEKAATQDEISKYERDREAREKENTRYLKDIANYLKLLARPTGA
jgi:TP901 family phage tail tape measure protein